MTNGLAWCTEPYDGRGAPRELDPAGHFARPDVFRLAVETTPRTPVTSAAAAAG